MDTTTNILDEGDYVFRVVMDGFFRKKKIDIKADTYELRDDGSIRFFTDGKLVHYLNKSYVEEIKIVEDHTSV